MKYFFTIILISFSFYLSSQTFEDVEVVSTIENVQPMTGIVFWEGDHTNTDAISLEYSYMLYEDMVDSDGNIVWDKLEKKLNRIAARNHQAIFRFRYTYVGEETSVPQYIKNLADYKETKGKSEGETTWFPDWSHEELRDFNLRFYKAYAEKYDGDPRIAFIQTGYGLWAEYHIYDGPFILGKTFPSMEYQTLFFNHLDTLFKTTPWSISIDAADGKYAPFREHLALLGIAFGNFDDSFMAEEHPQVNAFNWQFFDVDDRYKYSPAGGEFSYYTDWDQEHVLDLPDGSHGIPFEESAKDFKITYMIGNDQPGYQSIERIKQASLATGYKFQIKSFKIATDSAVITIENIGIAPFYYPAYVAVNGKRSKQSLQYLKAGETIVCGIGEGKGITEPIVTIESDYILAGQSIGFFGTTYNGVKTTNKSLDIEVFPTVLDLTKRLMVRHKLDKDLRMTVIDNKGQKIMQTNMGKDNTFLDFSNFNSGLYYLIFSTVSGRIVKKIIIPF